MELDAQKWVRFGAIVIKVGFEPVRNIGKCLEILPGLFFKCFFETDQILCRLIFVHKNQPDLVKTLIFVVAAHNDGALFSIYEHSFVVFVHIRNQQPYVRVPLFQILNDFCLQLFDERVHFMPNEDVKYE